MEKLSFYLKNQLVNPPRNWRETLLELNFNNSETKQRFAITDYEWALENAQIIQKHISDGFIFEGLPLRIELESASGTSILFDGYCDIPNSGEISNKIFANLKVVENDSIDWLNDTADSFTFEYLYRELSIITDADFVKFPYIISNKPDYFNAGIATVGVYVMSKELKDQVQKLKDFLADLPVFYVFSTYIKLALYIVALVLIIIALIKLIKDLVLLIIQPIKYHSCMKASTLLERASSYLGLNIFAPDFQQGGIYEKMHIAPEKYYVAPNNLEKRILGFTSPNNTVDGFYKGTFGDLLRDLKPLINGKVLVNNGTIYLVNKDYEIGNPQYTLPPIENFYYSYNANEFNSNVYLTFQTDLSEKNTIHEYLGTAYQVQYQPNIVINPKMVLMRGLEEVRFNFALAKAKTEYTLPETIIKGFLDGADSVLGVLGSVANAIIGLLNNIINAVNKVLKALKTIGIKVNFTFPNVPKITIPKVAEKITDRLGVIKLENDFYNVKKVFLLDAKSNPKANKLLSDNSTVLSAKNIYNTYYANSQRQYLLQSFKNVPFTHANFLQVKNNNSIFANNGNKAFIDSLKWNQFKQLAEISIRQPYIYTTNLRTIITEPDGQ